MERKKFEGRSSRRPRKPQSWARTRENGNSPFFQVAPRYGRGTIFAGSTLSVDPAKTERGSIGRDSNKYNQRTNKAR